MKNLNLLLRGFVAIVTMLSVGLPALTHDFVVDGIYYNITEKNAKTVEVTYQGDSYSSYSNEYSGAVNIPFSVTYNETTYSVTCIRNSAFYECSGLTSVTIPNSVTEIGNFAFSFCSGLTGILTIPNSVTKIGEAAFQRCSGLTSVTISNSVTEIGRLAFSLCSGLTGTLTIPNSVTKIGDHAFQGCSGLTSVTIPNSVTEIDDHAFVNCTRLTSVTIPNSVTEIGRYAFSNCLRLTSITIPQSVTEIGDYAFDNCPGLTSIVVENSNPIYDSRDNCNAIIETYTNSLIVGCKNTSIPNSVTAIGDRAFMYCTRLTEINIPNSVTKIGEYAFQCCYGLTSVTIPNSVTEIGGWAFDGCSLSSVTSCCETPPTCYPDAFFGSYSALLNVPKGTKEAYANAYEWRNFTNINESANVEDVLIDNNAVEVSRYDINGRLLSEPTRGVNIIKMSDGVTHKEIVK